MTVYYAVGDIHGYFSLLKPLYDKIQDDIRINNVDDYKIIFIGDYIDRGPDSKSVLDFLMSLDPEKHVFLMGNHEDLCLHQEKWQTWLFNGGFETCASFNLPEGEYNLPPDYIAWMKNLRLFYETDDFFFVHAGVEPGYSLDENKTNPSMLLWVRDYFLNSDYDWGKYIIHGHTPVMRPEVKHNRMNVDTGAFYYGTLTCGVLEMVDGTRCTRLIQQEEF